LIECVAATKISIWIFWKRREENYRR